MTSPRTYSKPLAISSQTLLNSRVASCSRVDWLFKWALPAAGTMTLTLTVPGGQGVAAAQVYEKL